MHIKRVVVEGFKSYRNRTEADDFSDKINTVVGPNGSGKSNFFQAIRFVLDAEVPNLRQEERQKMLHEGTGHNVLSAYVEIVLDNTDGRFPVETKDGQEVRIRRTINQKKDEYKVNNKVTTKRDLSNRLESAGFSKANPYYVVQQGKIMAMSTMKDEERLELLKEIGGSKVYEDRRMESFKILHDAEGSKNQIAALVGEIEAKLQQLDAEKEELTKYQTLDRERRSLEYAIYDKEVTEVTEKLQQLEEQRKKETERAGKALEERQAARASLEKIEEELKSLSGQQKRAQKELTEATRRKQDAVSKHARLELDIKELEEKSSADKAIRAQCEIELQALEKEVARAEKELRTAKTAVNEKQNAVDKITAQIGEAERRLQALDTKQGFVATFTSTAERDVYLAKEIKTREARIQQQTREVKDLKQEICATETGMQQLLEDITELQSKAQNLQKQSAQAAETIRRLEDQKDTAHNKRQDARRGEDQLKCEKDKLQKELHSLLRRIDPSGRTQAQALSTARQICKDYNIPVHGTILELVSCMEQLYTAVEVAAGGSLFQLVLDDDMQVSRLLSLLKATPGGGRLTCLPLNRLRVDDITYPNAFGNDAVPLTQYLKYDKAHMTAIKHVFGKWMVCKDSEVASKVIASTNNINCVTINGDVHAKKGTISGGYRDESRNRMAAYKDKLKVDDNVSWRVSKLRELRKDQDALENEVTELTSRRQQVALEEEYNKKEIHRIQSEIRVSQGRLKDFQAVLDTKKRTVKEKEAAILALRDEIAGFRAALGSKSLSNLSSEELREKHELQSRLERFTEQQRKLQLDLEEADAQCEAVEVALSNNLRKRQAELQSQLATADVTGDRDQMKAKQKEALLAEASMKDLSEREQAAQRQMEEVTQRTQELKAQSEQYADLQKSDEQIAEDEANAVKQLISKRDVLLHKKSELGKKIIELGSLPKEAFEQEKKSLKELQRMLARAQEGLKKYKNVNKKALDQYLNFAEQKDDLLQRHDVAERGHAKISQLINQLDMQKDEAIERTFKGVAKNFREIFAELAPGGKGELVMQKANPKRKAAALEEEEGDDAHPGPPVESYSGVKVKVSFGSGETMTMKQLSGGQKTLVALAIIFSIQRLDPAPFYLFDEMDAALDPAYRTTVADMLAQQANHPENPSQFIITTFHPQIVHQSERIYGVRQEGRVSSINCVQKEHALAFLDKQMRDAEGHADEEEW